MGSGPHRQCFHGRNAAVRYVASIEKWPSPSTKVTFFKMANLGQDYKEYSRKWHYDNFLSKLVICWFTLGWGTNLDLFWWAYLITVRRQENLKLGESTGTAEQRSQHLSFRWRPLSTKDCPDFFLNYWQIKATSWSLFARSGSLLWFRTPTKVTAHTT